jgi:4-amino-4-deoxy-L-arabinose transferase
MRLRLSLALGGVFLALYVAPLGIRPLLIPDETRYAEVAREMLVSGDWTAPRLNGLRYFEKPPLGYWLTAAAIEVFGENDFAIRLPSAMAAGLTALLLFVWVHKSSDDWETPFFAATIFLLSSEVLIVGTFCVLDSLLSLWVTAAIVAFFFAHREQKAGRRMWLLALAGLACGLAFLTKGFLGLVLPAIVFVPFAVWQRRFKTFLKMAWVPLLVALLTALPWSILIYRREPDFWRYFFWVEHVERFLSSSGHQHSEPFWYYVPVLLGGALPWTPLLGPIVQGLRWANWRNPMLRLAACWLAFPFLFFSVSSGKLGTYVLPCYPPLAFLIAAGVLKCLGEGDTKGFITGARVLLGVVGVSFVALLVSLIGAPGMSESVALWKWAIAAAGLFLCAALCRAALVETDMRRRLLLYSAAPVLLLFSWHFVSPAPFKAKKMPEAFLLSNAAKVPADSILVTDNALTASVCWYYRRSDAFITGNTGEYAYGLTYDDGRGRLIDMEQIAPFIVEGMSSRCVVLITREDLYQEDYEPLLPQPARADVREGLAFVSFIGPGVNGDRLTPD